MNLKVYNLSKMVTGMTSIWDEKNVAIVNGDLLILSDNEAIHTIHNLSDVIVNNTYTGYDIINSEPVDTVILGEWVRKHGSRIELNYNLLLKSIKEIGLNPKEFPRSE
jgi:hypothetical protein